MKIFVSYTLKDGYLDTSILLQVKELYRNSDSCYIDILDNDSVDKQGRVEQELQSADVLLLIETPMVMESKWVRYELDVAKSRNILIIKSDINNIKKEISSLKGNYHWSVDRLNELVVTKLQFHIFSPWKPRF